MAWGGTARSVGDATSAFHPRPQAGAPQAAGCMEILLVAALCGAAAIASVLIDL
jgi:hypothetical protein